MEFDFSKEPGKLRNDKGRTCEVKPLVSIITPYYNGSKYFKQTFNCVYNQTFPWYEWIIVDDGSKEDELNFLKQTVGNDPRIKIYSKQNGGPANTRNYAIDRTNTDIIVSLDADDLIEPTYLETTYWALYFNPRAGWAYTDSLGFGMLTYEWKVPFSDEKLKKENFLIEVGTIRKKALFEAGKYDDREKHSHEDWRVWLQIMSKKYYPIHLGFYGAWYRRIDNGAYSITLNDEEHNKRAFEKVREVADKITWKVDAIEYPRREGFNHYLAPKVSDFQQYMYDKHDKIRILMLLPWMQMGGADLFNLDFVKKIDKQKFDIGIMTTVKGENGWRQRFEEYTDEIYELPTFLDVDNYAEFISYYIKSRQIDVVFITNSYYGYSMAPWLRANFPELVIIDYIHMEEWYWRNGGYARISGTLGEIIEKTYVCNKRTENVMINEFSRNPESVNTVYIGVEHKKYDANLVLYGQAKERLGIATDRPCVLFPCRICQQKRPYLMLQIAKKIKDIDGNIAFMVVGDGELLDDVKQKALENDLHNVVYFAGKQEDMLPFYRDSDITLICSIKEGLALTAYESLSMGTPVISSDVGGQGELIDESVGAILPLMQMETDIADYDYSEEEIDQYVYKIIEILKDKAKYAMISKNCRERIESKFSTDIMIETLQNEITTLYNEETFKIKRRKKSQALKELGLLSQEFLTCYNECEARDQEIGYVWKEKSWFENIYNRAEYENQENRQLVEKLQEQLNAIHSMRTWKIVQVYVKLMNQSKIRKLIRKIKK